MTSALDTNILLDLVIENAPDRETTRALLASAQRQGAVVIVDAVYAELAGEFAERDLEGFLASTGIRVQAASREALQIAGEAWVEYTRRRPRSLTCARCGPGSTWLPTS